MGNKSLQVWLFIREGTWKYKLIKKKKRKEKGETREGMQQSGMQEIRASGNISAGEQMKTNTAIGSHERLLLPYLGCPSLLLIYPLPTPQ